MNKVCAEYLGCKAPGSITTLVFNQMGGEMRVAADPGVGPKRLGTPDGAAWGRIRALFDRRDYATLINLLAIILSAQSKGGCLEVRDYITSRAVREGHLSQWPVNLGILNPAIETGRLVDKSVAATVGTKLSAKLQIQALRDSYGGVAARGLEGQADRVLLDFDAPASIEASQSIFNRSPTRAPQPGWFTNLHIPFKDDVFWERHIWRETARVMELEIQDHAEIWSSHTPAWRFTATADASLPDNERSLVARARPSIYQGELSMIRNGSLAIERVMDLILLDRASLDQERRNAPLTAHLLTTSGYGYIPDYLNAAFVAAGSAHDVRAMWRVPQVQGVDHYGFYTPMHFCMREGRGREQYGTWDGLAMTLLMRATMLATGRLSHCAIMRHQGPVGWDRFGTDSVIMQLFEVGIQDSLRRILLDAIKCQ